jgi:hypothetical protein
VRRAISVLALILAFSIPNIGIALAQEECGTGETVEENDSPIFGRPIKLTEGTESSDQLVGTSDTGCVDKMLGHGGNDTLAGLDGWDVMAGGPGADTVRGGRGSDGVFGDEGIDELYGEIGNDWVFAIDGERDMISCGSGRRDYVEADRNIDAVARNCEKVRFDEPDKAHWWKRVMGRG